MDEEERLRLAEAVREACLKAALEAYEDSGAMGLCAEGRWEAAIGALQRLDPAQLASGASQQPPKES
jgi:hypothetical protein